MVLFIFLYSDNTSESEDGLRDVIDGSRSHNRRMEPKLEHGSSRRERSRSRSPRRRSGVNRHVDFAAEDLSSLPSRSTLPKGAFKKWLPQDPYVSVDYLSVDSALAALIREKSEAESVISRGQQQAGESTRSTGSGSGLLTFGY